MADIAATGASGKVVIKNIGLLLSGDIDQPILQADTIVVDNGLIVAVGREKDCDLSSAQTTIDAHQTCVCPGLIDRKVARAVCQDYFAGIFPRHFERTGTGG